MKVTFNYEEDTVSFEMSTQDAQIAMSVLGYVVGNKFNVSNPDYFNTPLDWEVCEGKVKQIVEDVIIHNDGTLEVLSCFKVVE